MTRATRGGRLRFDENISGRPASLTQFCRDAVRVFPNIIRDIPRLWNFSSYCTI